MTWNLERIIQKQKMGRLSREECNSAACEQLGWSQVGQELDEN